MNFEKPKDITDKEYWERYNCVPKDTDDFDENLDFGEYNHDINLDIVCKFRGLNDGVIYETKEQGINCNLKDLETFFDNLKKTIRMLDETISDKKIGGFG